jgi:hypothetical protein
MNNNRGTTVLFLRNNFTCRFAVYGTEHHEPLSSSLMGQGAGTATPSLLLTLDAPLLFYIMVPGVENQSRCNHFVALQRNG